jgi:YggT family protein
MQQTVINFVTALTTIYTLLIIVYILMSWLQLPYNPVVAALRRFLHDTVEPYLNIFRRMIPPIGMFDISPIVALIVLGVIREIVVSLIVSFG